MKVLLVSFLILLAGAGASLGQVQPAAIEGSVRDVAGHPVGGATVYAFDTARMIGRFIRITTSSDSNGSFALLNLPAGNYQVQAYKETDGYADPFFAFFRMNNQNASKNVQVDEGRTYKLALEVGPKCARLKVSIRNTGGSPIDAGFGLSFRKVNDSESSYSVGVNADSEMLVPPVPFSFNVSADGYQPWQSGILTLQSGEIVNMTVHLIRSPQDR